MKIHEYLSIVLTDDDEAKRYGIYVQDYLREHVGVQWLDDIGRELTEAREKADIDEAMKKRQRDGPEEEEQRATKKGRWVNTYESA